MYIEREQVEDVLEKILHQSNTDYNLGILSALYYLVDTESEDAEETHQELVTAMVYQQTMKYNRFAGELSGMTNAVAQQLGIPRDKLEVASKNVQEYIVAEHKARQEAANETQPNDSH